MVASSRGGRSGGEDPGEKIRTLSAVAVSVEAEHLTTLDVGVVLAGAAIAALAEVLGELAFAANSSLDAAVAGGEQALEEPGPPPAGHLERLVGLDPRLELDDLEHLLVLLAVVGVAFGELDHRGIIPHDVLELVAKRLPQVTREFPAGTLGVSHDGGVGLLR